jgi:hypothetical protein
MSETFYTVTEAGPGQPLKITDITRGVQAGFITPRGEVDSPIQVSGNRTSFIVKRSDGSRIGYVFKLPNGNLISQFRA